MLTYNSAMSIYCATLAVFYFLIKVEGPFLKNLPRLLIASKSNCTKDKLLMQKKLRRKVDRDENKSNKIHLSYLEKKFMLRSTKQLGPP